MGKRAEDVGDFAVFAWPAAATNAQVVSERKMSVETR